MKLTETLKNETKELKISYLAKIEEWSKEEYDRLVDFAKDFKANYDVYKERKYYALPSDVLANSETGKANFVRNQITKAEIHYNNSIEKLAVRIEKKGLNENNLTLSTSYLDPNISTTITDGEKTVRAFTIIASGMVQKPHYRYLIK